MNRSTNPIMLTWAFGDWNGDGEFTSSDLVLAFQDIGFEQLAARTVREPSAIALVLVGLSSLVLTQRGNTRSVRSQKT